LLVCRKVWGNFGQSQQWKEEEGVGLFLIQWELRISKWPISGREPLGDVKLE
jgi:hypothetical protein